MLLSGLDVTRILSMKANNCEYRSVTLAKPVSLIGTANSQRCQNNVVRWNLMCGIVGATSP